MLPLIMQVLWHAPPLIFNAFKEASGIYNQNHTIITNIGEIEYQMHELGKNV